MDTNTPSLSFIGVIDTSPNANWVYLSASVSDLLGFEPHELIGRSSLDLSHPDEVDILQQHHATICREKKAAVLLYIRLRHKDPHKGYITCASTCTVAGNHLIGGISAATSGSKAMHNASTAQEVIVISPSATHFEYRRWNDPTPTSSVPVSPISVGTPPPLSASAITSPSSASSPTPARLRSTSDVRPSTPASRARVLLERPLSRPPSPPSETRMALILDRFSIECTVQQIFNNVLLSSQPVVGRSFFDFVALSDEMRIRTAMETIKGWGVNERGHPSDGGFGFNKFRIIPRGRDSSNDRQTESSPTIQRLPAPASILAQSPHPYSRDKRPLSSRSPTAPTSPVQGSPSRRPRLQIRAVSDQPLVTDYRALTPMSPGSVEEFTVDAILSPQSDGIIVILRPALNQT